MGGGDQDGGEGHVGTVVEVGESANEGGGAVVVQWDCGNRLSRVHVVQKEILFKWSHTMQTRWYRVRFLKAFKSL